jgi:hypothetical protein
MVVGAPVVVGTELVVEAPVVVGTELLVAPVVPVLLVAVLVVPPVVLLVLVVAPVVAPVVPVLALVVAVLALVVVVAGLAVVVVAGLAVVVVGSTWQPGVPWPASALHPILPLAAAGPVYTSTHLNHNQSSSQGRPSPPRSLPLSGASWTVPFGSHLSDAP